MDGVRRGWRSHRDCRPVANFATAGTYTRRLCKVSVRSHASRAADGSGPTHIAYRSANDDLDVVVRPGFANDVVDFFEGAALKWVAVPLQHFVACLNKFMLLEAAFNTPFNRLKNESVQHSC